LCKLMLSTDFDMPTRLRLAVMRLGRTLRQQSMTDDITPSMLSALSVVERRGPLSIGELALTERVSPPSMTRVVGHLEERHLVTREVDATDRRVARLRVTPTGARTLAAMRTRKQAYLARRLRLLSEEDRERLAAALPVLERLVEDEEA
jgi:DNA-binding MarR family transcriptional regulator